ncbi:MAG: MerR family transcriptional regulator [Pseudomonadota bacterium]
MEKSQEKSPAAFRTISEVAEGLGTQPHVLRFWESKFRQVKPVKRAGGRRYYRPGDVALLGGIKKLLHEDGLTIKGVQKVLKERGIKHVAALADLATGGRAGASVVDGTAHDVEKSLTDKALRPRVEAAPGADPADIAAIYERLRALHSRLSAPAGGF